MGAFENTYFPYTDFHTLNLDILIRKVEALEAKVEALEAKVKELEERIEELEGE